MTFGVPYSFVPGTKAKADEVNANFIHVLNKIEETNTRVDETNSNSEAIKEEILEKFTQVEEEIENRVDLDFSNISDTAKEILDNKANVADIDGNWTWNVTILVANFILYNPGVSSFSLVNYLPNDGNLYEVIFDLSGYASGYAYYIFNNNLSSFFCLKVNGGHFSNVFTVPVGKDRVISFTPATTSVNGNTEVFLYARGYRKVR